MRKLGAVFVIGLMVLTAVSCFGAVYYFTRLETEKSDLIEARNEIRLLKEQLKKYEQVQEPQADTTDTVETVTGEESATVDAAGIIVVENPRREENVSSPVTISGRTKAVSTVYVRIVDGYGLVLEEAPVTVGAPGADGFGDYSVEISFGVPATGNGSIEVFQYSEKREEENRIIVPVDFTD